MTYHNLVRLAPLGSLVPVLFSVVMSECAGGCLCREGIKRLADRGVAVRNDGLPVSDENMLDVQVSQPT
jgi:hypothetical protein